MALTESIKVDGILDESSWKEVPAIESLTQVEPHHFESPTEQISWTIVPGNEIYIVLNHNWQENIEFDPYEEQTSLRVKSNYTFRF